MRNVDRKKEDEEEDFDMLSESIIKSSKIKNELSICDDHEDINYLQSELNQSMAVKQKQLIATSNSTCSVCGKNRDSCIVMSTMCMHQACIDCIERKITEPIQICLDKRDKIQVDLVLCKA